MFSHISGKPNGFMAYIWNEKIEENLVNEISFLLEAILFSIA